MGGGGCTIARTFKLSWRWMDGVVAASTVVVVVVVLVLVVVAVVAVCVVIVACDGDSLAVVVITAVQFAILELLRDEGDMLACSPCA